MNSTLLWNTPDYAPPNSFYRDLWWFVDTFLFPCILLLILIIIIYRFAKKKGDISKNWSYLIQDYQYSSTTFYQQVRAYLEAQDVSTIRYSTKNIKTGGILTGKRIYLVVTWHEYDYYICAAPYGNSFFISYWGLTRRPLFVRLVSSIPLIGGLLIRLFAPVTFYKMDTDTMFHTLVHHAVIETVESVRKEAQQPPLSEHQKTPTVKDLFKR